MLVFGRPSKTHSRSRVFFTAEVAAIDVLHDGAWGGWGFNVGEKTGNLLTFRDGGFQPPARLSFC